MIHLFVYLVEVSICLSLFYLIYILLINGDTFYRLKRFYLLVTMVVSLIIPQLPSMAISKDFNQNTGVTGTTVTDLSGYNDSFEKIVFGSFPVQANIAEASDRSAVYLSVLLAVYLAGILLLLYRFINNIYQILKIAKENDKESLGKYIIVHHNDNYPTFSFLKFIFLNSNNLSSDDMKTVIQHEMAHINHRHSADIIFVEFFKMLFWFNPVIWWFKKSLLKVHECQADDHLVQDRVEDIVNYQSLLLKQFIGNTNFELAHPFNYSLIRFRIDMMTKNRSGQWAKFKLIFVMPVIVFCFSAFTNIDTSFPSTEFFASVTTKKLHEPEPYGMAFIPSGSFVLKRTEGTNTKSFNVSINAFWMNQTEVSVKEYFEYTESVKVDSVKQVYEKALPDKSKAPFADYYSNKIYSSFPVLGISLQQAIDFCKWKTRIENQKLKAKGKPPVQNFRIPTEVEWVYSSFGGMSPDKIKLPVIKGLVKPAKSEPNEWGLYNMFDNASEWTYTSFDEEKYMTEYQNYPLTAIDKVIVEGNNYKNSVAKDKIVLNGADSYDYVGFRYVRTYLGSNYGKK